MTGFTPVDDPDDPRLAGFRLNERGLSSRTQRRDDRGAGWFILTDMITLALLIAFPWISLYLPSFMD